MLKLNCSWLVVVLGAAIASSVRAQGSFEGTVVSVSDGDTITVVHNGTPEKIRLLNVDAPEKGQSFGRAAKKKLSDLVYMQTVTITSTGKDKYGRTLGTVTRNDGLNANEDLIRSGYAWVYRARTKDPKFLALEDEAKNSRRGLWSEQNPVAPWQYRKSEKALRSKNYPSNIADTDGLIRQLLKERSYPGQRRKSRTPHYLQASPSGTR